MAVQREQVIHKAEKYVASGKIESAIHEYHKLLEDNPNDIITLNRIGDLYARNQRIDEAVHFFTRIAEQYSAEGFLVKAIAIYKKIIKLDPTRLEVYEKLAELYHKQGLVNEARTQYQLLADFYVKHKNAASAAAIYQKMVQLEPENPIYHVKLAEFYLQQQDIEKAMREYGIIAELMIQHGRLDDAAQVYERALDIDSHNLKFIEEAALRLRQADPRALSRFLALASERNPQAELVSLAAPQQASQPMQLVSDTNSSSLPPRTTEQGAQPTRQTSQVEASRPLQIFLCHSSADKPVVRDLYKRLRNDGFSPWLDEEDILGGQIWDMEIRKAVRAADVVAVCLSRSSVTKAGYVQKEIRFALDVAEEQPEGSIYIIPVKLEECRVPDSLLKWQWVSLFGEAGYERLLRSLRARVALGL